MRQTLSSGAALAASIVLLTSACGDDGKDTAEDPQAGTSASPSSSAEPSEPAEVTFVDFGEEPAVEPEYRKAALAAVDDDLITMVPSVLPDGWTTVGGGYQADPQWWRMEFTSPTGDVTLDQLPGTAEAALADASGLEAADAVDLSGTGSWSAWQQADGLDVLALDLKGSTVVLQGASPDDVRALAETLLPAEDAALQE